MKRIFAAAVAALLLPVAAGAAPVTYNFTQGGYEGGATVSGSFTGEDLNGDGYLYAFFFMPGELSAFDLSFSGNADVPAFTLDLSNLGGFIFRLGGDVLGDDYGDAFGVLAESLGASNGSVRISAASAINYGSACDGVVVCGAVEVFPSLARVASTTELVRVAPAAQVPEPAALGLLGFGALALGLRRRKQTV